MIKPGWKARGAISRIEEEHGKPIADVLVETLNTYGTEFQTAAVLGVYPNTVRHYRKKHNIALINGTWQQMEDTNAS